MVLNRFRGKLRVVSVRKRKARQRLCIPLIDLSGLAKRGWLTEENASLIPTQHWEWVSPIIWSIKISIFESLQETDKGFICREYSSLDVWFQYFLNGTSVSFLSFWKKRKKLDGSSGFRPLVMCASLETTAGKRNNQPVITIGEARDISDWVHLSLLWLMCITEIFIILKTKKEMLISVDSKCGVSSKWFLYPSYMEERAKDRKEKNKTKK